MIIPNTTQMLILVAVSLVCCCMGFKKFVWFMSIGYGLAAAGIGAALLIMSLVTGGFNLLFVIQCLLLVIYGIRLGGFLLVRELKNEKYRAKFAEVGGETSVPVFVGIFMWIFCGLLYICQCSPAIYRLQNGLDGKCGTLIAGIIISAAGIIIEALADKQKSEQKDKNPNLPAMEGLFRICRCPNYFGEILFWTGVFVSSFGAVKGVQWVIAILGYVAIFAVMVSGAKRLETRHIKHYGKLDEYNAYADTTPLLFPLIPIYHVVTPESIAAEEAKKAAKKAAKK